MHGLGTDIVSVARLSVLIQRHETRFLRRCFQPGELAFAQRAGGLSAPRLAACWSAKEAFIKAVSPHGSGVGYRDVEVVATDLGEELELHGAAREALRVLGAERTLISLGVSATTAVAVVLIP